MKRIPEERNGWTRLIVTAVAMLVAVSVVSFVTRAQESASNDTITAMTGGDKVSLNPSEGTSCTATTRGGSAIAVAVAVGNECSSWGASGDVPQYLYVRIESGKLTFRDSGKTYVVRDAATIGNARELFAPVREMMQKQSYLGRQMSVLGTKASDTGRGYSPARVSVPDLTAEFQKVEADAKRLSSEGGTPSELSELQSKLNELQSRISEIQAQASEEESRRSEQRSQLSDQMRAMSEEMNAMRLQLNRMSSQGHEAAEQATRQVKILLEQAIANGVAKQE